MKSKSLFYHYLFIVVVSTLLFVPFLGTVHLFDWDEINFAESAREMLAVGDYNTVRIDFEAFWEKPPLFIWMQAVSMQIFGVGEFAARFPNAVCGVATLLFLFHAGCRLYDRRFGILWMLSYVGSILPFFYFKSGIIDPWFNLFIFVGIYCIVRFFDAQTASNPKRGAHFHLVASAAAIGLGILTKGPVAFLIWGLTAGAYIIARKGRVSFKPYHIVEFASVLLLVGGSWFLVQIVSGNQQTVVDFVEYQIRLFRTKDAGHGGFLLYHFVVLFFGVFPASIFSLSAYRRNDSDDRHQKNFKLMMILLLWTVVILFTVVKTKIVHYSSMCYFPLTYLGAYVLYNHCCRGERLKRGIVLTVAVVSVLYAVLVAVLANIRHFKDYIVENELFADRFALANLGADAEWTGCEPLIALVPLLVAVAGLYFHRRGRPRSYAVAVLAGTCLFTALTVAVIAKRVEAYSQRAAIEFFESKSTEDCYILTMGYKSYAQYFYAKTGHSMSDGMTRLQNGDASIPVYVSTKNTSKDRVLKDFPQLEVLYEKNGFVFLKLGQENKQDELK